MAGRGVAVVIGVITAVTFWFFVGWQTDPAGMIGDEQSYKLQASLFASGQWSEPPSAFPEAFRQMHVLDQPQVASKYPPGHALLLAPGFLLGFPYLMPILLSALSGTLIFLIGRRWWSGSAGILAWLCWLTASNTVNWNVSWFSEVTSSALMLAGWWLLTDPRVSTRTLLLLGGVTGWLAITRPLTAVVFAIPVGVVLVSRAWQHRSFRPVLWPVVAGILPLLLLPIWSKKTTGDVGTSPIGLYTQQHMPWDRIGFGLDSTPPLIPLQHDQAQVESHFLPLHRNYTPDRYPKMLVGHARAVAIESLNGWRGALLPVALLGVVFLPAWLIVTAVLQFMAYGLYAHNTLWTLYYVEITPIFALGLGLGLMRTVGWLARSRDARSTESRWVVWLVAALIPAMLLEMQGQPAQFEDRSALVTGFRKELEALPDQSIVFVRYSPDHYRHHSLITNLAPRKEQRVLTAYDQGDSTNIAIARALSRTPFRYTEADSTLQPISVTTSPPPTPAALNPD